jgi:hypothetical protein
MVWLAVVSAVFVGFRTSVIIAAIYGTERIGLVTLRISIPDVRYLAPFTLPRCGVAPSTIR